MVSSLANWDGSLSLASKQNASRITDLVESAGASSSVNKMITTVLDEGNNTFGNGHGWHSMVTGLDVNHMVRCLLDGLCIVAQVAVYLVRRVKFKSTPIA